MEKQTGANDSGIVADGKYENEVFEKSSKTKSYDSGAYVSSAYTPAYNQSRKSYNSNSSTTSNGESKTKTFDSKPQVKQKSIRKKKEFAWSRLERESRLYRSTQKWTGEFFSSFAYKNPHGFTIF